MLVRRIARPLLASPFIYGGIDTLRNPQARVPGARPVVEKVTEQADKQLPVQVPRDVEQWVKIDAAVKVGAGALFALGKLPRLSALAAVGSIVPTTLAGHRFWEHEDPKERFGQLSHFLKNARPARRPAARRRRHRGQAVGRLPGPPGRAQGRRVDREELREGPEARRQGAEEGQEAGVKKASRRRRAELTAPARGRAPEDRLPPGARPRAQLPGAGAFRTAAAVVDALDDDELDLPDPHQHPEGPQGRRPEDGDGRSSRRTRGEVPEYLAKLEEAYAELVPLADDVAEFRAALRGDLHAALRLVRRRQPDPRDGRGRDRRSATSTWRSPTTRRG